MFVFRKQNEGFVALMSVIVISAFLLVMIFTLGVGTFFTRINILDTESKRVSLALAESCASRAMLSLSQNPAYVPVPGGECVGVGDTCGVSDAKMLCMICEVGASGADRSILTRAVFGGAYTNLRVTVTLGGSNLLVKEWRETAAFGGAGGCAFP
jgi:hypothetical protein